MYKQLFVKIFFVIAAAFAESSFVTQNEATDILVPHYEKGHNIVVKRHVSSEPIENFYIHNGYQGILIPEHSPVRHIGHVGHTDHSGQVGFSAIGLLATVFSYSYSIARNLISYALADVPALLLGSLFIFGICKLTSICAKLSSFHSVFGTKEMTFYATPERLARATEFVQNAIKKFSNLQNEEDNVIETE